MDNKETLLNTYNSAKLLLNDSSYLLSNFENGYKPKTDIEEQIREKISESIKTVIADSLDTANLIGEVYNANNDETELKYILDELEAEKCNKAG